MTTNNKYRIVVEPNELMRQGLINILVDEGHTNCVAFGTMEDMEAGIDLYEGEAVFLVNLGRDDDSVAVGIKKLKSCHKTSRVVLLSDEYSRTHFYSAIQAGASGYILTSASCEALVKSLEMIALGQPVVPAEALELVTDALTDASHSAPPSDTETSPLPPGLLSDRELAVLRCICGAMSNKKIARECNIREATVKVHVKAILRKINGKNRTEAAIWALEHGLKSNEPATHPEGTELEAAPDDGVHDVE